MIHFKFEHKNSKHIKFIIPLNKAQEILLVELPSRHKSCAKSTWNRAPTPVHSPAAGLEGLMTLAPWTQKSINLVAVMALFFYPTPKLSCYTFVSVPAFNGILMGCSLLSVSWCFIPSYSLRYVFLFLRVSVHQSVIQFEQLARRALIVPQRTCFDFNLIYATMLFLSE